MDCIEAMNRAVDDPQDGEKSSPVKISNEYSENGKVSSQRVRVVESSEQPDRRLREQSGAV